MGALPDRRPERDFMLGVVVQRQHVLAALGRWNVPVDDSGGDALSDTPSGVFARLVAEAALEGLPPVTLLALLKHEKCSLDRRAAAALERAVLRGPRPKP